jgi:hypothetical protein
METGDNSSDLQSTASNPNLIDAKQVVINLRYDGITLLIATPGKREVIEILEGHWLAVKKTEILVTEVQNFLQARSIHLGRASSVHWVMSTSAFALVPDVLFHQGDGARLLKHTSRLGPNDVVHSDFWTNHDAVAVYALPQPLKDFITSLFEKSTISHCGHSFNSLYQLQSRKKDFFFLQVSSAFAELFMVNDNRLTFFNQFAWQVHEDLLYMLLSTFEENRILPPEVNLNFAGKMAKGDALFKLLTTYIGELTEMGIPAGTTSARHISPNQLRKTAHLIACL